MPRKGSKAKKALEEDKAQAHGPSSSTGTAASAATINTEASPRKRKRVAVASIQTDDSGSPLQALIARRRIAAVKTINEFADAMDEKIAKEQRSGKKTDAASTSDMSCKPIKEEMKVIFGVFL